VREKFAIATFRQNGWRDMMPLATKEKRALLCNRARSWLLPLSLGGFLLR
jgi:hypothetical protein